MAGTLPLHPETVFECPLNSMRRIAAFQNFGAKQEGSACTHQT